ncbi:hypothetical protein F2Q68_00008974 [Brassica cretica]|uniref:Uncharacterized protein n=1 Tax=Brassica cretica TaxID=69181 RepID=A0A8S9L1K9_BRACR|nr:hypothetical protein F2Q68_00008974 [Brassica cretica]
MKVVGMGRSRVVWLDVAPVTENGSDLTWSLRDVALIDRKLDRPRVVAARRRSDRQKTRATSRGRCETSLRERLSSSGHRKCGRLGPVALILSLQLELPRGVAAEPRSHA